MFFSKIKNVATASLLALGAVTVQAQTDDLPDKGTIQQMITPTSVTLSKSSVFYNADLTLNQTNRWSYSSNALRTGDYASNSNDRTVIGNVTLPKLGSASQIYLNIKESYSLESNYDYGKVLFSTDGGQSWNRVHGVTGKSGPNTSQINVSRFAGQEVLIALELTSDSSFESTGWNVFDLNLEIGIPTNLGTMTRNATSVASRSTGTTTNGINISGINDDNFPEYVYVDFTYTQNGVNNTSLQLSDLVRNYTYQGGDDNGGCPERLYGPDAVKNTVDIMFLIDNSGSMSNEQNQVLANIETFIDGLSTTTDARYGLLRFGQSSPIQKLETTTYNLGTVNFTPDKLDFKNNVLSRNVTSGGTERGYDALKLALTAQFRPNAAKVFILITDENVINNNGVPNSNQGPTTKAQIINDLKASNATVYSWIPNDANYDNTYANVACETGGQRYDILNDISGLTSIINNNVSSTYTLRYCPKNDIENGITHGVSISLVSDNTINDFDTYIPEPNEAFITRNSATVTMSNTSIQEDLPVDICFNVKDNLTPFPINVDLFLKPATSPVTSFVSVPMTVVPDNSLDPDTKKWCAAVPSGANGIIKDPGFNYYAIANYADGSQLKSPTVQEEQLAYSQAVWPNFAPEIVVTSTAIPTACSNYNLNFTVSDQTDGFTKVDLYYREIGVTANYTAVNIYTGGLNSTLTSYTQSLPVTAKGLEYYIVAEDNFGISSTKGDFTNPIQLLASPKTLVATSTIMGLSFSNLTLNCNLLQPGDKIEAYYIDDCGTSALGGQTIITAANAANFSFLIYGDDPATTEKDGFSPGENVEIFIIRNGNRTQIKNGVPAQFFPFTFPAFPSLSVDPVVSQVLRYLPNNTDISNGDVTPSMPEGTDFGFTSSSITRQYKFINSGCGLITYSGISNNNTTDFIATLNPTTQEVEVTFLATNTATATISVNTSIGIYTFDVKGTVNNCIEEILFGSILVPDADDTPSVVEGTDFGTPSASLTRTFNLSTTCGSTISSVTSNNSAFTVSNTSNNLSVTYNPTVSAYGTISIVTTEGTYKFDVTGTANPCTWGIEHNSIALTDGDVTPTTTDGTDFGTISSTTTKSFDLTQSGCSPAVTIISASTNGSEFTATVNGSSIDVTHAGNTSETATVTVITSDGSFAFDVEATVQPVNNPVTPKFSNPLGIWASYIAFDIDVHSPTANVSGKIINTTTGSTLYTLNSSTLHNWNHPGVSTQHYGSGMGVLPANSNLSAVITVTNNGSYSGVYTFPFTTN